MNAARWGPGVGVVGPGWWGQEEGWRLTTSVPRGAGGLEPPPHLFVLCVQAAVRNMRSLMLPAIFPMG